MFTTHLSSLWKVEKTCAPQPEASDSCLSGRKKEKPTQVSLLAPNPTVNVSSFPEAN